jgi:5-methylcytosine-specific restriction endonuclease McrA
MQSELKQKVFDRDDGACLVCNEEDELVAHTVDEDEPDELVNRLTLCVECDEDFVGLHPMAKRTKAHH